MRKEVKEKIKNNGIRNTKIFAAALRSIYPYVLLSTITFEAFSLSHSKPFIRDTFNNPTKVEKEIDSLGKQTTRKEYVKYNSNNKYKLPTNEITHYSKWKENQNKTYTRNVEVYQYNGIIEDDVKRIFSHTNEQITELLDKPDKIYTETTNEIDNNEEYFVANINYINSSDTIPVLESTSSNIKISIGYSSIVTIDCIIIALFRRNISKFSLSKKIKEINKTNPKIKSIKK